MADAASPRKTSSPLARFGQRAALSGALLLGGGAGQQEERPQAPAASVVAGAQIQDEGGDEAFDEADARAQLIENQQRASRLQEKQQEDAKQAAAAPSQAREVWSLFIGWVSKAALASIVGAFLWFPFLLVVGDMVFKGTHRFIPGVTWDLLLARMGASAQQKAKYALLPDYLAKGIALFMLLVDIFVVCLITVLMVIQVYVEYKAIMTIAHIFGPLTNNMLDLWNLPHIPLP